MNLAKRKCLTSSSISKDVEVRIFLEAWLQKSKFLGILSLKECIDFEKPKTFSQIIIIVEVTNANGPGECCELL